ncbi:MAG: hypothetical protein RL685_4935 [Pseudomonadota bacterium]|jgi:hypothetical protein
MSFERYTGVHGEKNVQRTLRAIEACGGKVLKAPDPTTAPYEISVGLPNGDVRDLVCYAFTANKYRQGGRPLGEHRLQVKYGSDFTRYHDLYIDPKRRRTTLMFGVHHELDLFIAVDPVLHNPTWFSRSIELKEPELLAARAQGWHGWERDRSRARRKRDAPLESFMTEAIFAFTDDYFLRYVETERHAAGLDAAERLVVGSQIARFGAPTRGKRHPLEELLGLGAAELLDVLAGTTRLLTAVRGRVAEHHLGRQLAKTPGVSSVETLDLDGQPDFLIDYKGKPLRIECKNVATSSKPERPLVDFQKTRAAKSDPCSRYYAAKQFEVLAACLHPITKHWEYRFCLTTALAPHKTCHGKLSERVYLDRQGWSESLDKILRAR